MATESAADVAEQTRTDRADAPAELPPAHAPDRRPDDRVESTTAQGILRAGRLAWAAVGLVVTLVVLGLLAGQLTLVVVPLVIALFPAALLWPVASFLKRHKVPASLASAGTILGLVLILAGAIAIIVPVVAGQLPDLAESFGEGVGEIETFLEEGPLPFDVPPFEELLDQAQEQLGGAGEAVGGAVEAATTAFEAFAGILFGLVALFFYLKDGERIAAGIRDTLPERTRPHVGEMAGRAWYTLGAYFRGQLLVALVDAVAIGIGLLLLGVPLALPLAFLVFLGGLFPIVGALVSGFVAVLVALAFGGFGLALAVLALIVAVQQLESNLLEPVILSRAISLHPLAVLTALTAGGVTLGILGAFLAVPVAASVARMVDYLRGREMGLED
jgi:putative heme transporter